MRNRINQKQIKQALQDLFDMIQKISEIKGFGSFVNSHEVYGILAEEMAELLDTVRANDSRSATNELMDIAVAAIWGYISEKQKEVEKDLTDVL